MTSKKSLGKKLHIAFEKAGAEGLVPSDALERYDPNWDTIRQTLSEWEKKGKITCTEKRHVSNISRYILSKYAQEAQPTT